jgi:hypothetical protein
MKTSEILDKVTLEFAGGGKLALSDYAPYISNADAEVEGIGEEEKEGKLFKHIYEPDLFGIELNNDPIFFENIEDITWNNFDIVECLYKKDKMLDYIEPYNDEGDGHFYPNKTVILSVSSNGELSTTAFNGLQYHTREYNGDEYLYIYIPMA